MKVDILGVKIDDVTMDEALRIVEKWIWNPGKHYIVTPNPEFIMTAQKDLEFKKILNNADLSIPDGNGLKLSGKIKNNISGGDLMERLVALSSEKGFVVGLFGGLNGVAEKTAECLKKKYSGLKLNVVNEKLIPVDILFVAFGAPKQEKWIYQNLSKLPVKIAMGVGGAFDYMSGKVPRAPKWIRDLGFEWLFRLIIQPWRIKRQISLIKYLWLICVKLK